MLLCTLVQQNPPLLNCAAARLPTAATLTAMQLLRFVRYNCTHRQASQKQDTRTVWISARLSKIQVDLYKVFLSFLLIEYLKY